jgi:hypothetical protein
VVTTSNVTTSSIGASTTRFTGDFGGGFAFTSAFRVFDTIGAAFFALVASDFGCNFSAFCTAFFRLAVN